MALIKPSFIWSSSPIFGSMIYSPYTQRCQSPTFIPHLQSCFPTLTALYCRSSSTWITVVCFPVNASSTSPPITCLTLDAPSHPIHGINPKVFLECGPLTWPSFSLYVALTPGCLTLCNQATCSLDSAWNMNPSSPIYNPCPWPFWHAPLVHLTFTNAVRLSSDISRKRFMNLSPHSQLVLTVWLSPLSYEFLESRAYIMPSFSWLPHIFVEWMNQLKSLSSRFYLSNTFCIHFHCASL